MSLLNLIVLLGVRNSDISSCRTARPLSISKLLRTKGGGIEYPITVTATNCLEGKFRGAGLGHLGEFTLEIETTWHGNYMRALWVGICQVAKVSKTTLLVLNFRL
jgi:hypothetical protein